MSTSNTWFTSDTHFQHWSNAERNIIKYSNRPFSTISEHDAVLEANWNDNVKPEDTVYHLGDICLGNRRLFVSTILPRLNGNIKLVPGNHDRLEFFKDTKIEILPRLYDVKFYGVRFVLSHYSLRTWEDYNRGSIQLFGHSHHSLPYLSNKSVDIGVDGTAVLLGKPELWGNGTNPDGLNQKDYRPLNYDELMPLMRLRENGKIDHH